ncbi:MAG: type II and III secretion system protein, partial [Betaproteobacteria bacterium]|nr:type II and III secretion system protein [Betaproteobacteria bacterium]
REQAQSAVNNTSAPRPPNAVAARTNRAPNQPQEPDASEAESSRETVAQTLTFREAASVIVNPETGTLNVRATSRQHERVAEFIEQIVGSSRRQVLIEATVVEVLLNDNYQSGVDWSSLGLDGFGYSIRQNFTGTRLNEAPFFSIEYKDNSGRGGGSASSITKLLSSFGQTKVLSSPKIMTLNNQTAVMKVVDNRIYFVVQSTVTPASVQGGQPTISYNTTPNVVPEGFVMNVTPQISDKDIISLNIRPSVTRITGFVKDPNPDLARAGVANNIPEIQTREFESMLRLASGQTAVLGGLMQDSFAANRDGLPLLSRVPVLGDAVSYRNDTGKKSEFVVFLRATVIREANIDTELADFRRLLPDASFFKDSSPSLDVRKALEPASAPSLPPPAPAAPRP